jgi:hypothetical protein
MQKLLPALGLLLAGCSTGANAQALSTEQELLNVVINHKGRLVYAAPLPRLYFTWRDTADLFDRRTGSTLTTRDISRETLTELVRNSYQVAAEPWTPAELDSVLLVDRRGASLYFNAHWKSMSAGHEQLTKFYKKAIRHYNATDSSERDIASYTRPVFDASKQYALIEYDNGYMLGGGGYIKLYRREKSWREIGMLKRWAH